MSKSILDIIKQLCSQKGITLTELERLLNFSTSSILKWDRANPSIEKVRSVADFFNVSIDYIIGRTSIRSTADEIFDDKNIMTIQRLRSNLSTRDNEKMMRMIRVQFEEDFPKEDDNDIQK